MRALVAVLCLAFVLSLATVAVAQDLSVQIQVAPATIVLKAPCQWVTVHADISFSSVSDETVQINGSDADLVFPDNRGELVAKIAFEEIASMVAAPSAEITLTGVTTGDVPFSGSATVRVK